jgi:hypothetical protein
MPSRAPRQPLGWAAHDWKYGRHIYGFRAGVGKFIKRELSRWRRHQSQREVRQAMAAVLQGQGL